MGKVDSIIASAGTGKTTRLVELIAAETKADTPAEKLLGTTFTVRAANELVARARGRLIKDGDVDRSSRLLAARLGTVNGVCGQLIGEFAFDLGRSPSTEVVAEQALASTFNLATDSVIGTFAPRFAPLADAFGFAEGGAEAGDWRKSVKEIVDLARANGMDATALSASSRRSLATLDHILPKPVASAAELDASLAQAIDKTVDAIDKGELAQKTTDATAKAVTLIRKCKAVLARGDALSWPDWLRMAKLKPGKQDEALFKPVKIAAAGHAAHPRLLQNLHDYVETIFECVSQALAAYADYKGGRGLVDFTDQEVFALELLQRQELRTRLAERIEAVFVDEFQDSSPIQIAIFAALSRIARRSAWVGDPKQAIYGFRGSAPDLTMAAAKHAPDCTGGTNDVLSVSWRSRPSLVEFFNAAFTPAFVTMGLANKEIAFSKAARTDPVGAGSALHVWWLQGKNKTLRFEAIAQAVRRTLERDPPVRVGDGGAARKLEPGDIAILARSGDDVADIAAALNRAGLKTAVEQGNLLSAPEVELTLACLQWVADGADRLAMAKIARLLGGTERPGDWLTAAQADDPDAALAALIPFATLVEDLRQRQMGMTPSELLDALVVGAQLIEIARCWGNARNRTENVDALRQLAKSYEDECANQRKPATVSRLALHLQDTGAMLPASRERDAIAVMTYHKAKGLEWPFVVLSSLEGVREADPFRIAVETEGPVDWRAPLQGRWIRLWPWPYGSHKSDGVIDAKALNSDIGRTAERREHDEAIRLLYVGMTRARDYLVLTLPSSNPGAWLELLDPKGIGSHVELPAAGAAIKIGGQQFPAEIATFASAETPVVTALMPAFEAKSVEPRVHAPLVINPSGGSAEDAFGVLARHDFGWRMPIAGTVDMQRLGEAIHSAIACDTLVRSKASGMRLANIAATLDRWRVTEVAAADVLSAADHLWKFMASEFAGASWRSEVPLASRIDDQLIRGRIDLLIEGTDWFAILDHKSFPGNRALWEAKAVSYAPQLSLYARGVEVAIGKQCRGTWVHMPVAGVMLHVAPQVS